VTKITYHHLLSFYTRAFSGSFRTIYRDNIAAAAAAAATVEVLLIAISRLETRNNSYSNIREAAIQNGRGSLNLVQIPIFIIIGLSPLIN